MLYSVKQELINELDTRIKNLESNMREAIACKLGDEYVANVKVIIKYLNHWTSEIRSTMDFY